MSQPRKHSAIESVANTAAGFVVSYAAGFVVFPLFGWEATPLDIGWITVIYTGLSVVRNYVIRRLFNGSTYQVTD